MGINYEAAVLAVFDDARPRWTSNAGRLVCRIVTWKGRELGYATDEGGDFEHILFLAWRDAAIKEAAKVFALPRPEDLDRVEEERRAAERTAS
ncbi:MAG TPA: hypothetical protein VFW94_23385 [Candidatus Acidoferrales bacterium]|nr:hypothetical protein [Candidatus Acidoferrales bacterium]